MLWLTWLGLSYSHARACVCARTHACMHACVLHHLGCLIVPAVAAAYLASQHNCAHTRTYTCRHVGKHAYEHVFIRTCTRTCARTRASAHAHKRLRMHARTRTRTHARKHAHTHARTHRCGKHGAIFGLADECHLKMRRVARLRRWPCTHTCTCTGTYACTHHACTHAHMHASTDACARKLICTNSRYTRQRLH